MKRTKSDFKRFNASLTEPILQKIHEARSWTAATSDSETIRHAFIFYYNLVSNLSEGCQVFTRTADGHDTVFNFGEDGARNTGQIDIKVNLNFPKGIFDYLGDLQDITETSTSSGVLREAVSVYHQAVAAVMEGGRAMFRQPDGEEGYYWLPIFYAPRPQSYPKPASLLIPA